MLFCYLFVLHTRQLLLVHLLENVGAHPVRLHYVMEQPVTSCYLRKNYIPKMLSSKRIVQESYRECLYFLSFYVGGANCTLPQFRYQKLPKF